MDDIIYKGVRNMTDSKGIKLNTAIRNIESSMRAEGFRVSRETKALCSDILRSGKNATELANYHVSETLKKAR